MAPSAHALNLAHPLSSPPQPRIRLTPPLPRVASNDFVLADSALRALLDEFLTRNGNRVQLSRIVLEEVGPSGEALDGTHVGVEGMILKPIEGGYERIDLSLGWSHRMGFKEGCTKTRVAARPLSPFFAVDLGLCLTVERIVETLRNKGRPAKHFHQIVFSYADGRKDHPVWTVDFTRIRLFGPRREKATVDDITGESSFQIF